MPRGVNGAPAVQPVPVILAAAIAAALIATMQAGGWRPPVLLAFGGALGLALAHSAFGFAAAYRNFLLQRRADGILAQLLMLAAATVLFAPVLAAGEVLGHPVTGAFAPVGVSVAIGAFMFGLGMQLAGGCGSGVLFALGGGSGRMVLALIFFCVGSFAASLHVSWWERLPGLPPIVLGQHLGWGEATALQLGFIALLAAFVGRRARNSIRRWIPARRAWLFGPWPLAFGALALAILNFATVLVAGHPWSITWAFALWAAKAARAGGWDPDSNSYWSEDFQHRALERSILEDTTSIMDIGIVLGALLAAGLAGRFSLRWQTTPRAAFAAILGGALMGYGARIAYGCNVGAFFSGVASTSLHGWLWIAAALGGSALGLRLRPRFGLSNDPAPWRAAPIAGAS